MRWPNYSRRFLKVYKDYKKAAGSTTQRQVKAPQRPQEPIERRQRVHTFTFFVAPSTTARTL